MGLPQEKAYQTKGREAPRQSAPQPPDSLCPVSELTISVRGSHVFPMEMVCNYLAGPCLITNQMLAMKLHSLLRRVRVGGGGGGGDNYCLFHLAENCFNCTWVSTHFSRLKGHSKT